MKSIKIYIVLIFAVMLTSCERVLDQKPLSEITQANFWNTPRDAETGLIAVYNLYMSTSYTSFLLGEVRSDNLEVPPKWGFEMITPDIRDFTNNVISSVTSIANWTSFFNVVARANEVLYFTERINFADQSDKDRILGEAYFLRASAYFTLVRNWGAVPLFTTPFMSQGEDMYVERTPAQEIYQQIVSDLELAETLLPVTRSEQRVRVTRAAAQALLCDVLLTRSYQSFAQSTDLSTAIHRADQVIANSNYSLSDGSSYESIFRNGNSSESIFEVAFNFNNNATHNLCNFFLPRAYNKFRPYGGETLMLPSHSLVDAYEPEDLRTKTTFTVLASAEEPYFDDNVKGMIHGNKYLGTVTQAGMQRYSDDNVIVYRLSDVLLMKAEALVQTGQISQAMDLVTTIRERAGLTPKTTSSKEEALDIVLDERRKELAFEGKRWYDLVRTGKVEQFRTDPEFVSGRYLLPVAQTEIDRNPKLLPQNPTY